MKKLFLFLLLLTPLGFAQSGKITIVVLGSKGFQGIYDGTERITNEIDRTQEPVLFYSSDFSAGVNSWDATGGSVAGNIDGIGGKDNVLRFTSDDANVMHRARMAYPPQIGNKYAKIIGLYIPSANTKLDNVILWSSMNWGGGNPVISATDAWTYDKNTGIVLSSTNTSFYARDGTDLTYAGVAGDVFYVEGVSIHQLPTFATNGNHSADSNSTYKQAGTYSTAITASGAGSSSTHFISLASARFTAVKSGGFYRFQVHGYTTTADVTLTFNLGDITETVTVPTDAFGELQFDFKATASTTGNIKLYLNKAATVYLDEASLKEGR